ncbi:MAG TPA: class I SAM-dependent methyltransferase [Acidimicrobiales bacterium]|nr:class I SAM-dependent methyltransferase [Acidimicrobiales bacterium]
MADVAAHWDGIYSTKASDEVSWFQDEPRTSLRLLGRWAPPPASVLDVGAGTSHLVGSLLDGGWADVTILDVSVEALNRVRARLGERAEHVSFIVSEVCSWEPERVYDAWHDRAVFHFLIQPEDREQYVALAAQAVAPGGVMVLATFAANGPTECSGLPTARYGASDLARVFGPAFALEHAESEEHSTPRGTVQSFTWAVLRRTVCEQRSLAKRVRSRSVAGARKTKILP